MGNRERVVRAAAAWVAVAATVPYLTLKILWLTGHPVGSDDPAAMDKLWLVNLLTFGMDAIAVALALAFVRPWGRRVPAGLVAFPMWVATGLLGTILVAMPLSLLSTLVLGPEHQADGDKVAGGLRGWVFAVVYGGFSVQGLALITGFVLYARQRWAGLLRDRIGALPDSPTLTAQRTFAGVAALLGLGVAVARTYWAAGGTAGVPSRWADEHSRGVAVMDGVGAVMAVAAAAALLVLVFRIGPRRRLRVPLVVAWTAAGSLFGWGSWQLVAFGSTTTRVTDVRMAVPGLMPLVQSAQVVAAVLILAVGAMALTERAAAARAVAADVESAG
ncbi:hypothetical protein F7Q99_04770 [Streptomyces kaniharaensis]|uniref:LigA protein n=1 Tax=Streptomyces kaniharaensis TaxID=212423 RepID=A0A6N7KMM3_9ACTN|nr:hypothetical protein [Streptomyces kaniharaensis]MQS11617.1 hypothetical protein [Streptomyces kaniharaensis]